MAEAHLDADRSRSHRRDRRRVEGDEPRILVAGDGEQRDPRGPAVRSVRSRRAPHLRDRPARLGRRRRPRLTRRLCRAALHLRRSRPPCASRRHRPAHDLGRLSRAHPHAATTPPRCARPAPASSPGTASSPGRTGARAGPTSSTRPSCRCSTNGRSSSASPEPQRAARPQASGCGICFGGGGSPWDEEKVLDRYELLYEAGLVEEARRDGREAAVPRGKIPQAGRADALRPPPHRGDRDRAAARQAQISPGGVRAAGATSSR